MKTRIEKIEEFLGAFELEHVEMLDYINVDDIQDADELTELLQENGAFNIDIIYYHNAMEFLMEHDPSLNESISLASEAGYDTSSLSSELLASLLASEQAHEEYQDIFWEIERFFDELNELHPA